MQMAFIGLGLIGAPIAERLLAAGHHVELWNRSRAKAEQVAAGRRVAQHAADAVENADIIFLCLTDANAINELVFGQSAIASSLKQGAIIVDLSTNSPDAARSFAARLPEQQWLDAPVSGGVAGAQSGTLTLLVGGDSSTLEVVRPVLNSFASHITFMGGVGAGQAAKLCNQLIVSANLIAIAEAIALGRTLGVDVERLPEALAGGFADSRPLQLFGPRMASRGRVGAKTGTIATMAKDVRAISDASHAAPRLHQLEGVARLFDHLIAEGRGENDLAQITALYGEEW